MTFLIVVTSALCTDSFKAHSQKGIHHCALALLWLFLRDAREDLKVQQLTAILAAIVSLWYYTEEEPQGQPGLRGSVLACALE